MAVFARHRELAAIKHGELSGFQIRRKQRIVPLSSCKPVYHQAPLVLPIRRLFIQLEDDRSFHGSLRIHKVCGKRLGGDWRKTA